MDVLISADAIQKRVDAMAREITEVYQGEPVTIVGVLTGCVIFVADLIRRLDLPLRIAFIQASSYRGNTTTSGDLVVNAQLLPDLTDRHVLLLDDILDTGKTLGFVVEHLNTLKPKSVRVAVLMRKIGRQTVHLEPDFVAFAIPDAFVVGYGLDYNDEYRNLPYIGVLPEAHH